MTFRLKYSAGKLTGISKLAEYDNFAMLLLAEGPVHCEVFTVDGPPDYCVVISYGKVISVIPNV